MQSDGEASQARSPQTRSLHARKVVPVICTGIILISGLRHQYEIIN